MTGEIVIAGMAKAAYTEVIKKAVGNTLDYISKKYGLITLGKSKDKYLEHYEKILKVRTLASNDVAVFIDEIYVPLTLKAVNKVSITVGDQTTLDGEARAILIKGLAGQGKSTLLRKLIVNNLQHGSRFPMFYELKNYKGGDIEDALSKNMALAGVDVDKAGIEKILSDSNTKLYLDAFDEVNPDFRGDLYDQIFKVMNRYMCYLVCTTRPDTVIDTLSIDTYNVDTLNQNQVVSIIRKTATDKDKSTELCAALIRSPLHSESESILKSPILVVLYCISYNLGEEIPHTLSQFYANIFDTVFYRHDNMKGKVNRVRHWNDNRAIYRELFNSLCYVSQRAGSSGFKRSELVSFLASALEYMGKDKDLADKICDELRTITNLIIDDGFDEYRFVHKSIQEFFSASFIKSLDYELKMKFYNKCSSDYQLYSTFSNTLFFLEEIDYYDYCGHYYIPAVSNLLGLDKGEMGDDFTTPETLVDIFIDKVIVKVKYSTTYNKQLKTTHESIETSAPALKDADSFPELYSRLFSITVELLHININDDLGRYIVKQQLRSNDGEYHSAFKDIMPKLSISKQDIKGKMRIGIAILFREKYNAALLKTKSRKDVINTNASFLF